MQNSKSIEEIEVGENFLKDFIEWKRKRGTPLSLKELEKFRTKSLIETTSISDLISELSEEDLRDTAKHVSMLARKKKIRKTSERRKQEAFTGKRESEKIRSTTSRTVFRTR